MGYSGGSSALFSLSLQRYGKLGPVLPTLSLFRSVFSICCFFSFADAERSPLVHVSGQNTCTQMCTLHRFSCSRRSRCCCGGRDGILQNCILDEKFLFSDCSVRVRSIYTCLSLSTFKAFVFVKWMHIIFIR